MIVSEVSQSFQSTNLCRHLMSLMMPLKLEIKCKKATFYEGLLAFIEFSFIKE